MKNLALLLVAVLGTSVLATAAPIKLKTATAKEVTVAKKYKHKTRAERKEARMEASKKTK